MKNLLLRYLLPLAALGMLGLGIYHVRNSRPVDIPVSPPIQPATSPFTETVAGSGIVEAETENIEIGSALPGVVAKVFVKVGQEVSQGNPLFQLDEAPLRAQLAARQADFKSSEAQLARLRSLPRPEDIPIREAAVREAAAIVESQQDLYRRTRRLRESNTISEEQLVQRQQAVESAVAVWERAQAELSLLKAGAWKEDLAIADAAVQAAQAQVNEVQTEIARLTVRASVDGEILQVNIRPGEFVGAPPNQTLVLMGNVRQLRVRVDIDEYDIPRFRTEGEAVAVVRGHPEKKLPLHFVRVEPYVIPKRSLTGENTERVDTRVLQVIYDIDPLGEPLYVGQQLDAFIKVSDNTPPGPIAATRR